MTATLSNVAAPAGSTLEQQLAQLVCEQIAEPGMLDSGIPGVSLYRADDTSSCASTVYEPSLIFILQGTKTIELGDR